jgi:hypothetical protein
MKDGARIGRTSTLLCAMFTFQSAKFMEGMVCARFVPPKLTEQKKERITSFQDLLSITEDENLKKLQMTSHGVMWMIL